jgi:hypothetical protein
MCKQGVCKQGVCEQGTRSPCMSRVGYVRAGCVRAECMRAACRLPMYEQGRVCSTCIHTRAYTHVHTHTLHVAWPAYTGYWAGEGFV